MTKNKKRLLMSFPFFTCGGWFYWIDRYACSGWRIQESMWTHRCRLLDPFNIKRGSGSFDDCRDMLSDFLRAWEADKQKNKAVVLIHGLFQRPSSFYKMAQTLQRNYEPIIFSYPTLRFGLMKSAAALNVMLENRPDLRQIDFVVCGMGGLILRQACALNPQWVSKIGRSVFIAVPNQGYSWAKKWKDKWLYRRILGEAGKNILPETAQTLPSVNGEFGIILGGKDDAKGIWPFFKEDNDGLLRVEEARCAGAKEEYMALNKSHFFLHKNDKLIEMTQSFLTTGRFGRGIRIRKEQSYTNIWDN